MFSPPLPIAKPGTKVDNIVSCLALLSAIDSNGHHFGRAGYVEIALGIEGIVDPRALTSSGRLPSWRIYTSTIRCRELAEFAQCRPPRRQVCVKPIGQSPRILLGPEVVAHGRADARSRAATWHRSYHHRSEEPPAVSRRGLFSSDLRPYAIIKERCRDGYATWRPRRPGPPTVYVPRSRTCRRRRPPG